MREHELKENIYKIIQNILDSSLQNYKNNGIHNIPLNNVQFN